MKVPPLPEGKPLEVCLVAVLGERWYTGLEVVWGYVGRGRKSDVLLAELLDWSRRPAAEESLALEHLAYIFDDFLWCQNGCGAGVVRLSVRTVGVALAGGIVHADGIRVS